MSMVSSNSNKARNDDKNDETDNYQTPLPNQLLEWQKLEALSQKSWSINELFANDNQRVQNFSLDTLGMYFDYSKQCLNVEAKEALIALANARQLTEKIQGLFSGERVNGSENRAALHTALRLPMHAHLTVDGQDVVSDVHESLRHTEKMVTRIRQKIWRGYSGKAITDVVNIGVGGSDLGPLMANSALEEWADSDINVHFVSNMDGSQLGVLLGYLNPETTLFIISSKSFSTVDTLSNAQTAKAWLLSTGANQTTILRRHFIGISANLDKVTAWGIPTDHQLRLWEWVGGRFSMWSAIGLAVAIRVGMPVFREMLAGAHSMDEHFRKAELSANLPVLLGLIGVWNSTFLGINAHTVLPYDGRLRYLPSYLTQLEMESNGKSVTRSGQSIDYATCPILWGEVGSNAQHAFYQLLHQGTQKVSCDFIACVKQNNDTQFSEFKHQHALSLANCLAQSRVLAFGNQALPDQPEKTQLPLDKFKYYRGNQPSSTLLLNELTPKSLGSLIALYEHKVFVMACIWDVNPFDQWGVEMGKIVANEVFEHLHLSENEKTSNLDVTRRTKLSDTLSSMDNSTQELLLHINNMVNSRQ